MTHYSFLLLLLLPAMPSSLVLDSEAAEPPTRSAELPVDVPASGNAGDESASGPVIVIEPRTLDGIVVSRAADGAGAPVGLLALTAPGPARVTIGTRARGRLTSGFGYRVHPISGDWRFHSGIDIAGRAGTAVVVAAPGIVVQAGRAAGYGLLVTIDHGGGLRTRYGHLSSIAVRVGQSVRSGDVIGAVGSTGSSTGPHLHYEVRIDGRPISPLPANPGR